MGCPYMVSEFKKFQGAMLQFFETLVIACIENRMKKKKKKETDITVQNRPEKY